MTTIKIKTIGLLFLLINLIFFNKIALSQADGSVRTYKIHNKEITDIFFSKDGKSFFSSSLDSTIKHCNINQSAEYEVLKAHKGGVTAFALSADNSKIISGGEDKKIILWDLTDTTISHRIIETQKQKLQKTNNIKNTLTRHQPKDEIIPPSTITALCFATNNTQFFAGYRNNTVKFWETVPQIVNRWERKEHKWSITSLDLTDNGRYLLSASADNTIKVWNVINGRDEATFIGHRNVVNDIDINIDDKSFISASNDHSLIHWDLVNGKSIRVYSATEPINAVEFSADGQFIAAGCNRKIVVWKVGIADSVILQGHKANITTLTFSPDDKYLLTGADNGEIKLWYLGDIIVRIVFAKEIEKEISTNPKFSTQKDEFETIAEYKKRLDSIPIFVEQVIQKYRDVYYNNKSIVQNEKCDKIRKSYHQVNLKIDTIGIYHPENKDQYFYMQLSVIKSKKSPYIYPTVSDNFKIPREDARKFKEKYKKAEIKADVQLDEFGKNIDIFNIKIKHPDKKEAYPPQKTKNPLYLEEEEGGLDANFNDSNAKG